MHQWYLTLYYLLVVFNSDDLSMFDTECYRIDLASANELHPAPR